MNNLMRLDETTMPAMADYKHAKPAETVSPFEQAGPLMDAAIPALALIQRISQMATVDDASAFRLKVVNVIQQFEYEARLSGVPALSVLKARYVLCATLDELILNTPWGQTIGWYREPMLALFHEDTWGGEKFFNFLQEFQQEPSMHVELLLLMYMCLSLGFQGKYRLETSSVDSLEHIRQHLMFVLTRFNAFGDKAAVNDSKSKPIKLKKPWFWRVFSICFTGVIAVTWTGLLVASEYNLHQSLSVISSMNGG